MTYAVLDTETTGLEPGSRPVEIYCSILLSDGSELLKFHGLCNPMMPIPPDASKIHGITDADVNDALPFHEVAGRLVEFIKANGASRIIGHNIPYDVGIVSWSLDFTGIAHPEIALIDTCAMAKEIKATKKNSLDALVEHYGIKRQGQAHRAESDALACRDYWKIADELIGYHEPTPWACPFKRPTELPTSIAALPDLIATGSTFSFAYTDDKGTRTDRTIIPYGYHEQGGLIYLHGLCQLRGERRTFRADRVAV